MAVVMVLGGAFGGQVAERLSTEFPGNPSLESAHLPGAAEGAGRHRGQVVGVIDGTGADLSAVAPIIANLVSSGRMSAKAYPQNDVFEAAVRFARVQGPIAAPETSYALRAVMDEARQAREEGDARVILFSYSGHGLLDLAAYDDYLHGRLYD